MTSYRIYKILFYPIKDDYSEQKNDCRNSEAQDIARKCVRLHSLNPVAPLIETFRYGFLGSGTFPWQYLILSFAVTAVVLLFGIIVFNRVEKNFIDTV